MRRPPGSLLWAKLTPTERSRALFLDFLNRKASSAAPVRQSQSTPSGGSSNLAASPRSGRVAGLFARLPEMFGALHGRTYRHPILPKRGQISSSIPHFVIVGAPKCGTTSLYRYLQQHPRVFMPENKEPRFFCDYPVASFEFGTKQFHPSIVTAPDEYLGLFCDAPPGAILGEASTDYLSCPGVAERLHAWNPDAKIIVMLRDPIDRAYSEYQHSIAANFQTLSFAESLREDKRRFAEGYDPIFAHVRRGLYADGVKDFQQKFGQSNVKVILFEQFSSATQAVVQSVFEFLALSPMKVDVSERYGSSKSQIADPAHASWVINDLAIGELNRTGPRAELSRVEYESLRGEFVDDVRRLASLVKIDLSKWLRA